MGRPTLLPDHWRLTVTEIECLEEAERYCHERAAMERSDEKKEVWRRRAEWNRQQRLKREAVPMKLRLTDRELILLGYDEPDSRDDPDVVREIVRKTGPKPEPLGEAELARLRDDCRYLPSAGETDPADARSATRLRNKVFGEEQSED